MNMKVAYLLSVLLIGISVRGEEHAPASPLTLEAMDADWKEMYDKVKGDTYEEKAHNALTTWEMKAVSEYKRYLGERELVDAANTLLNKLDKEGRELFIETHSVWQKYIELQAEFMTDSGRGGSARGIYWRSIISDEYTLRTKLYRDMAEGKNVFQNKLYIYSD